MNSSPPYLATQSRSLRMDSDETQRAGLQDHVAGLMAIGVIHPFEVIDITEDQGKRTTVSDCPLQLLRQVFVEIASIVRAREGVCDRKLWISWLAFLSDLSSSRIRFPVLSLAINSAGLKGLVR
jgi:hypothetical protein